jgi:hypothetical protein
MNKALGFVLAAMIVCGIVPLARSIEPPPGPPPGIAEQNWVPMGQAAGFVVTDHVANDLRNGLRSTPDVVTGYFMVKRAGKWLRVDAAPVETYKAVDRR